MPASKTLKKVQKNRDCPESTAPLPKSLISLKIWLTKYKIINMLTKYNYLGKAGKQKGLLPNAAPNCSIVVKPSPKRSV